MLFQRSINVRFLTTKSVNKTTIRYLSTTQSQHQSNTILVWGGSGVLGQSVINTYNKLLQCNTINVDYIHNNNASINVVLDKNSNNWKQQTENVLQQLEDKQVVLNSVICTAGVCTRKL